MDHEVGLANDAPAEVAVTDVPDDEAHPIPVDEVGDIVHVPRVRQLVEDREARLGEDLSQVLGYMRADEPAAPSNYDIHCIVSGRTTPPFRPHERTTGKNPHRTS